MKEVKRIILNAGWGISSYSTDNKIIIPFFIPPDAHTIDIFLELLNHEPVIINVIGRDIIITPLFK